MPTRSDRPSGSPAIHFGPISADSQLEVRGPDGDWRADVMTTSPDDTARMAWEAQLSPITTDETW